MVFDVGALKTFFWYLAWSFNIPEEFKKQVVSNLIYFNPAFTKEFWPIMVKTICSALVITLLAIVIPIVKIVKTKNQNDLKFTAFTFFWFIASLAPVIFLNNHTFAMYLAVPSIGIYICIANLLTKYAKTPAIVLILVIWIYTSMSTIIFYKNSSWVYDSQNFARTFARDIKNKYPTLEENSVVYYPLNDKRHIQALSSQNALKVIYNDPSLQIIFNQKDLEDSILVNKLQNKEIKYFRTD